MKNQIKFYFFSKTNTLKKKTFRSNWFSSTLFDPFYKIKNYKKTLLLTLKRYKIVDNWIQLVAGSCREVQTLNIVSKQFKVCTIFY